MNMKYHSLFLSTVSVIFFGGILAGCHATFVSGSPASTSESAPQPTQELTMVREQPEAVVVNRPETLVVNRPIVVRETRATTTTIAPAAIEKPRVPLVLTSFSGNAIKHYTDGRKYIKSKEGYFYWEGYDTRWYMEENDLKKVNYTDEEYIDWTTKGKKQNNSIPTAIGNKNTTNQPGNSAFGHSRGNRDKVEKPVKEMSPSQVSELAKEKEQKEHIEKEAKDKKAAEENLAKEKEQKEHIEKEAKDKKDHEEKLAKEKEQKEHIEKEAKDKKNCRRKSGQRKRTKGTYRKRNKG
jgi:hypothetical protein